MTYKSESGIIFSKAFEVVQWAYKHGCKVRIYKGENFVRWLV